MKLTDRFVKNVTELGRFTDSSSSGFQLYVRSTKGKIYKTWLYRYQLGGNRSDFSLGTYPKISLAQARKRFLKASSEVLSGQKPCAYWRITKVHNKTLFKDYALKYITDKSAEWRNKKHHNQWINTLETYAFPILGNMDVKDIQTEQILLVLKPIWTCKTETAYRLRGRLDDAYLFCLYIKLMLTLDIYLGTKTWY